MLNHQMERTGMKSCWQHCIEAESLEEISIIDARSTMFLLNYLGTYLYICFRMMSDQVGGQAQADTIRLK